MSVFVGIDGGGTRARALAVDAAGVELARVMGPAGIVRAEDPVAAADVMSSLTQQVLAAAGEQAGNAVLCCALAGAGREMEREAVRVALAVANVAAHVLIVGDAEAMLADALGEASGVLLIAGTGSIAWARAADGRQVRVGGWGLLLGDEGSGYDLGLAALRAIARADDGRAPPTSLTRTVLDAVALTRPSDLIAWGARAAKADIGRLAPLVLQAADAGDAVAAAIRSYAVQELTLLATTAAREAGLTRPSIVLAGGLIAPGAPLRAAVVASIEQHLSDGTVLDRSVDGARGATLLARLAAGR